MSDYQVLATIAKYGMNAPALENVTSRQWVRVWTLMNVAEVALQDGLRPDEIRQLPVFLNAVNEHRVVMHLQACQRRDRRLAA